MPTLLSPHWTGTHKDARDLEIFREWQPPTFKLFESEWHDVDLLKRLYHDMPNTLFVLRDWPLSEQKEDMNASPAETGRRHAREWSEKYSRFMVGVIDPARTLFLGINEPMVRTPNERDIINAYTVAFLDTLKAAGLRGGALNLSVGWPDNTAPNTRAAWELFDPVYQAIRRGNHVLMVHEYWSQNGPMENWGWWAGRIGQCPWDVKIIVGECGIDMGVVGWELSGWQAVNKTKEQYMAELAEYDRQMRRDRRVLGLQVYTYDFGNNRWHSFDVRPIREDLAAYARAEAGKPNPHDRRFPYYPSNVTNPLPPGGTPPPPPRPFDWTKIPWAMEEATRILEREGYTREAAWILNCASYREAVRNRG